MLEKRETPGSDVAFACGDRKNGDFRDSSEDLSGQVLMTGVQTNGRLAMKRAVATCSQSDRLALFLALYR
jgi:hypothetical protein